MSMPFPVPEGRLTRKLAREIMSQWMVYCRFHGPRDRGTVPARVRRAYRLFTKYDRKKQPKAILAQRAREVARARKAAGGYVSNFNKAKELRLPAGGRLLIRDPKSRKPMAYRQMVELEVPGPYADHVYRYKSGNSPRGYFRMTRPGKGRHKSIPGIDPFPWTPIPKSIFDRLDPLIRAFLLKLTRPRLKRR